MEFTILDHAFQLQLPGPDLARGLRIDLQFYHIENREKSLTSHQFQGQFGEPWTVVCFCFSYNAETLPMWGTLIFWVTSTNQFIDVFWYFSYQLIDILYLSYQQNITWSVGNARPLVWYLSLWCDKKEDFPYNLASFLSHV